MLFTQLATLGHRQLLLVIVTHCVIIGRIGTCQDLHSCLVWRPDPTIILLQLLARKRFVRLGTAVGHVVLIRSTVECVCFFLVKSSDFLFVLVAVSCSYLSSSLTNSSGSCGSNSLGLCWLVRI